MAGTHLSQISHLQGGNAYERRTRLYPYYFPIPDENDNVNMTNSGVIYLTRREFIERCHIDPVYGYINMYKCFFKINS